MLNEQIVLPSELQVNKFFLTEDEKPRPEREIAVKRVSTRPCKNVMQQNDIY